MSSSSSTAAVAATGPYPASPPEQHPNPDHDPDHAYINYPLLTAPTFSPTAYANSLVLATNDAADAPLDLSTPLSRVLFDVQEVDTRIDSLTTQHAGALVDDTRARARASGRVLAEVEEAVKGLEEGYRRLEREIGERYAVAEQVRVVAERMLGVLRLGRGVGRCVQLVRQLEGLMEGGREGRGMVEAARTVVVLRGVFAAVGEGEEGEGLARVQVVNTLRADYVGPSERALVGRAQQGVREFSMSSLLASGGQNGGGGGGGGSGGGAAQTYAQTEEVKSRATSALQTLYLLSPTKPGMRAADFEPTLLLQALQSYLHTALTSSVAALARALATLPTLDRTLLEISARCQNLVALESLLASIPPPAHPLLPTDSPPHTDADRDPAPAETLLTPLLTHLDTSSLPSYFWRSLAGQLAPRVQEILARGGVSARTLRSNKERVRDGVRECVDRGSRVPGAGGEGAGAARKKGAGWEREAAVMVGSVVGPLGR